MVRKLFGVLCVALVLCLGAVLADEIMGTIVKVDAKAKTVTVKGEDGKETEYKVETDTKLPGVRGANKGDPPTPGTLETLTAAVAKAKDNGKDGVKATIIRDDKSKKLTEIKTGRGKGKGGVDQ